MSQTIIGKPLFLTKNEQGRFAALDIADYEKMQATIKLMSKLSEGERNAQENGWKTLDDLRTIAEG